MIANDMVDKNFGIDNNDPKTCQRLCEADSNKCKAWTFVLKVFGG